MRRRAALVIVLAGLAVGSLFAFGSSFAIPQEERPVPHVQQLPSTC